MYKTKFNSNDTVNRHKSQILAQGFTQTLGVYYMETFSLVVKINTVRALLFTTINCGWSMSQLDVKNAFLHGDLEEDIYIKLPL